MKKEIKHPTPEHIGTEAMIRIYSNGVVHKAKFLQFSEDQERIMMSCEDWKSERWYYIRHVFIID